MATLSTLLGRIHDEFPSVPEGLALRALADSAKEFFTRTHAWQDKLSSVSLRVGSNTYDLSADDGVQIVALKDVRIAGERLVPAAVEQARLQSSLPGPGVPSAFVQVSPTSIELNRAPADAARLTVRAALTLALNATAVDIPDTVFDEYGEAIAQGAKMRLVRQASQPWSAPEAGSLYATSYYSAINAAKIRAMSSMGEADMQVQYRSW